MHAARCKKSLIALILAVTLTLALPRLQSASLARTPSDEEYRKLRILTEVLTEIERKYVEPKPLEELIEHAVKGMVSGLDPHSAYLTPEEYEDLRIETKGSFSGVGIEITMRDGVLTVVSPIEGTPADQAGVLAGDRIIKIDGKLTKGMSLMDAVKAIRGPKGSPVVLTLMQESGKAGLRDVSITRDVIPLRSVRYNILEDGYGYVRVSHFQENTTADMVKGILELQSQKVPLKGLVLDLRNDPGGLLQEAVNVADQFLSEGLIVTTKGRVPNQNMSFEATKQVTAGDYPMICLVNNGSASASEIVAGALQDHGRALIVGTATFGKGSVQTIIPLQDDGALRLTTARYYTPKGRAIQAKGITPDLMVAFVPANDKDKEKDKAQGNQAIREKDLQGAMAPEGQPKKAKKDEKNDKLMMDAERLSKDNQLQRALELLKAWQVFAPMAAAK